MATRVAWVLNLDAELELSARGGYTASATAQRLVQEARKRVVGLVRAGDWLVTEGDRPTQDGPVGQCWSPTPNALARLASLNVRPPLAPSKAVLREVNHRAFALSLIDDDFGPPVLATSLEQVQAGVAAGVGQSRWLAKRVLGFAGRGHRRLTGELGEADRRWCAAALREAGSIVVEPLVERAGDFVLHGLVCPLGKVTLGSPVVQQCDDHGRWLASDLARPDALGSGERLQLMEAAEAAGRALHRASYHGPYGIDAFRYRDHSGRLQFRPLVELNARYCMGWGLSLDPELALFPAPAASHSPH